MRQRLGRVAREARETAELKQLDIATAAGISHAAVSRFESGHQPRIGIEKMVAVYEAECDLQPEELWRRAALT